MDLDRRRFLLGLSAMALAPAIAACGSDDSSGGGTDGAASGGAGGSGAEEGAFPVTVEHKWGSTEITEAPQRVVVVGLTDQDALLALGVVPVAVTKWFGEAEGFIFPWATDALGDGELPEVLEDTNGVQIERIAGLAPDLIIGQYAGTTEADYERLSQIAPTVVQPGDYADFGVPWDEATLTIGAAIGRPQAAQDLVDQTNATIQQYADDNPEFQGKRAIVVTPFEGLFVYGPEDPRNRMLEQLGFEFPDDVFDQEDEFGVSVSAERTSELGDLDTVVWIELDADPAVRRVFEQTTAAEEGRFFSVDQEPGDYYVSHSFVTPLSIPYTLERYVPQLAAAVDGDPSTEPPAPES